MYKKKTVAEEVWKAGKECKGQKLLRSYLDTALTESETTYITKLG